MCVLLSLLVLRVYFFVLFSDQCLSFYVSYSVKNIRRIYGRIAGNELPGHVPLFLREPAPVKLPRIAG